MVKQVVFLVMAAMAMGACSTEQNIMEQVRMSDVVNSGCISSFSATESRPEYYKAEKEKSAKMLVSVDAKGIAHFQVTDLQESCAVNGFREVRTIAPLSFITLLYCAHNGSNGITVSHLHEVEP